MDGPSWYSHAEFMREYDCIVEHEFELNGHAAAWAPDSTRPRLWDEEDEAIDLPSDVSDAGIVRTSAAALTSDGRYLAIAINTVVRLYDVETLELRRETSGYASNVSSLSFQPRSIDSSSPDAARDNKYVLVSQTLEDQAGESRIFRTVFDSSGGRVNDGASFPLPLRVGKLPGFGSKIWGHNGQQMLYTIGPASLPPEIVILNMPGGEEACRLTGHKDSVVWAAWSPDSTLIATASWDHTFGLWVAISGVRRHTIQTNGQNWSGAFFNDGRHILLSGGGGKHRFGFYDVETGNLIVALQAPEGIRLDRRLCDFSVHTSRDLIVLRNGRSLLAWMPFESSDHHAVQVLLALQADPNVMKNDFGALRNIKWVDRGRKLIAQGEDQTIFAWEPKQQWKWKFQRPKGRAVEDGDGRDVLYLRRKGAEWVVSVGENKLRLWKL